jgi:HSP20 family protein
MPLSLIGRGWPLDPFREIQRLHADMNRVFNEYERPWTPEYPPINIWSGSEGAVVTAQLAGVDKNDLEITVHEDTLTIKGERKSERDSDQDAYHRRERPVGRFARTIVLPYRVDTNSTEAIFQDGVLAIRMVRPAADRPKRVEIATR